jgi:excisionase family DNA binding protein
MANERYWLSLRDAATYAAVSSATIQRAVKRGALKAYRVNGERLLHFRVGDLDQWLSSHEVAS